MRKLNAMLTPLVARMKATMKGLMALLLFIASGGMVLAADNAAIQDEPLPPEVKKLIGMKLQPKVVGRVPAHIPGFYEVTGALLGQDERHENELAYGEGVVANKWAVFIVERFLADKSVEILDAQMLPENLIEWRIDEGNRKYLEGRYRFSVNCHTEEKASHHIFGLVKTEKGKSDCAHFSKQVKLAWRVDRQSGRITPTSSKGMRCEYITMSACY